MFRDIEFTTTHSKKRLTSKHVSNSVLLDTKYNPDNLLNSNFSIIGSVDTFNLPPINNFTVSNLYYAQSFNIFHYGIESFTERQNFHSYLILYTYAGQGSLVYREKKYNLSKGDGFFIDCVDYHSYKVTSDHWDTAVLHLDGPLLSALHHQFMLNGSPIFHENMNGDFQAYLEKILTLYSQPQLNRDWLASSCINSMLSHLLILTADEASKKYDVPQNILSLIRYMEKNYTKSISLDDMANHINMDKFYLSKEFKKYTGFSPHNYLISLRIQQAKMLLKNTSLPAVIIAYEVGIPDSNNFNNLFKKRTHMTPIQYRNSPHIFP